MFGVDIWGDFVKLWKNMVQWVRLEANLVKSQFQDPLTKALKNKNHQILLINRQNQMRA